MSNDLDAFPLPPGRTAQEFIESGDREALAEGDSMPTPEQRATMERTAAALLEIDPSAERFEDEDSIELKGEAVQVSLFAGEAGISIPYWFEGDDTIFDPQTGEVVDPAAPDRTAAQATYGHGVEMTNEIARDAQRPWWKIWG